MDSENDSKTLRMDADIFEDTKISGNVKAEP